MFGCGSRVELKSSINLINIIDKSNIVEHLEVAFMFLNNKTKKKIAEMDEKEEDKLYFYLMYTNV